MNEDWPYKKKLRDMCKGVTNVFRRIRIHCLHCNGFSESLTRTCPDDSCPLWPYRMGKNPFRAPPSEKQIESAKNNMRRLQEKQKSLGHLGESSSNFNELVASNSKPLDPLFKISKPGSESEEK